MNRYRLTPMDLSENPALGILVVVLEALRITRLALCAAELPDDEFLTQASRQAASQAYAFAIISQIQALEDTIRSYGRSLECLNHPHEDGEDTAEDEIPF